MFPLVSVWVRQWGAWKHHPYNFIAQECVLLPFWLHFDKLWGCERCYWHMCIHNNITPDSHMDTLVLTAFLPHYHMIFSLSLFTRHIPHYNRNRHTHYYTSFTTLQILLIWTTCPMKFSHPYLTMLCFAFYTPAHHNALICKFSVQV